MSYIAFFVDSEINFLRRQNRRIIMKKLSLLIALCMLLTIGGVYAQWTYTNTSVDNATQNLTAALGDKVIEGKYGTYAINTTGVTMSIDPKSGTTHNTALTITGNIVITFTPGQYAPEDVKDNAVSSKYAFSLASGASKYDNQNIFTLNTEDHTISWTKNSDGNFTYTIDAATLATYITLTEFTLDTTAKYDAYSSALATNIITITVSDS